MNYSFKQSLNCIGIAKPYHENLFIIGDDENRDDITCLVKLDKDLNPIWGSKKTQQDYFEIFDNVLILKTSKKTFDVYNIADMSLLYTISTDYELGLFMAEPSNPDIFYNIAMKSIYVYNKQDGMLLRTIKRCKGYIAKAIDNGFIIDDFAGNCSLVDKEAMKVLWKYSFEDGFFKNPDESFYYSSIKCWVLGDHIIVSNNAGTVCLNKNDGSVIWKNNSTLKYLDTEHFYVIDGVKVNLFLSPNLFYYISLDTGLVYYIPALDYSNSEDDGSLEVQFKDKWYMLGRINNVTYNDLIYWFICTNDDTEHTLLVGMDSEGKIVCIEHITNVDEYDDMVIGLSFFMNQAIISTTGQLLVYAQD